MAISKEDMKYLASELNQLMDAQKAYKKAKDKYCGNEFYGEWWDEGLLSRELMDEIDLQAASVSCFLDVIIENKIKEMMNVT